MLGALLRGIRNLVLFVVMVCILAALAGVLGYLYVDWRTGRDVIVPSVIGLRIDRAYEELIEADLRVHPELQKRTSEQLPEDTVLHQEPLPGSITKEARQVRLVISVGTRYVRVPDVRTRDLVTATQRLREFGLSVQSTAFAPHPNVPADAVIAQDPPGGVHAHQSSGVDLLLSLGPEADPIPMPDLIGLSLNAVEKRLGELGLRLGVVEQDTDAEAPPGTVATSEPAPETRVYPGTTVNLVVAAGIPGEATAVYVEPDEPEWEVRFYEYTAPLEAGDSRLEVKVIDEAGLRAVREYRVDGGDELLIPIPVLGEAEVLVFLDEKMDLRGLREVRD